MDTMKKFFILTLLATFSLPIWAGSYWCGDLNKDGMLDDKDMAALADIIMEKAEAPSTLALADTNGDGKLSVADIVALAAMIKGDKEKKRVWVPDTIPVDGPGSFD